MSTFKVGEVAILQNCKRYAHLNGEEVVIEAPLGEHFDDIHKRMVRGYCVELRNVEAPDKVALLIAAPHQLRKKPPKSDDQEWAIKSGRLRKSQICLQSKEAK